MHSSNCRTFGAQKRGHRSPFLGSHRSKRYRLRHAARRGATTVEFAIAAPVFLLMVFSCIEFCRLNMIRNLAQDAAYFAARECMVPGATVAEAESVVNRMLGSLGTRGVKIDVNGGAGLNDSSDRIRVVVRVPIGQNALVAPRFTKQLEFVGESTFRTERKKVSY
jgi:Flp pilus assembly protein TadG